MPYNVKLIEDGAFYNCQELLELSISNKINAIAFNQFVKCENLKKIYWNNKTYSYSDLFEYGEFKK